MIKRILVTGSSGMIGTRLCERLLKEGYEVAGFDWIANRWNDEINRITVQGDLRNKDDIEKVSGDQDLIIHLAANARVYNLVVDPVLARDNFETTFQILNFAREHNIPRFLFASSREVYGNSAEITHKEEDALTQNCESTYTASKIGGEAMVHAFQQCYGIDFAILRFSNVYGMYDESDRVMPRFLDAARTNEDVVVFGEDKLLDFTYIDDCIEGIMKTMENFEQGKNDVYNIASGVGTTLVDVAKRIQELTESKGNVILKENRTGEVVKFIADISKARAKLFYAPQVSIQEGLEKAVQWYKTSK